MTAPSEALADLLERHAEHFGMDDTTTLQEAIETLAMAEKMTRIAAVLPDSGDTLHIVVPHQCGYRSALEEIDGLDPNDFMGGQGHLTPAFRQPDIKAAFRKVVQIVNRVLYQTDEYGKPLPVDGPRSIDHLARAVVEACMVTDDDVVTFKVTSAEYTMLPRPTWATS